MSVDSLTKSFAVSAAPEKVFEDWLSSEGHAAMTGARAEFRPEAGAPFVAWGGYITGTVEELSAPSRFVLRWRTLEFPEGSGDSRVEVRLSAHEGGTQIEIAHTEIPEGQGPKYDEGWDTHYLEPMTAHYGA